METIWQRYADWLKSMHNTWFHFSYGLCNCGNFLPKEGNDTAHHVTSLEANKTESALIFHRNYPWFASKILNKLINSIVLTFFFFWKVSFEIPIQSNETLILQKSRELIKNSQGQMKKESRVQLVFHISFWTINRS